MSSVIHDLPAARRRQRVQAVVHPRQWVACPHTLGGLPCVNHQSHSGVGRGCVHYSRSGVPDRHGLGDDE